MPAPLRGPLVAHLWITDACQLRCSYCYADCGEDHGPAVYMDPERGLALADELARLGVFYFTVSGGEPLLHPDALWFIESIAATGMPVALLTNGLLLDDVVRLRLRAISRDPKVKFLLQISLDSADEAINDRTRGGGSTVIENIEAASRDGLPVQISCVLTRNNLLSAHQLIDRFYPAVKRFHFLAVQPTRRSLRAPALLVTKDEVSRFWLRLEAHTRRFGSDISLPSLRTALRAEGHERLGDTGDAAWTANLSCSACVAGLTHVNVAPSFDVFGCDIARDGTLLGNVRSVPFSSVWESSRAESVRRLARPPCETITRRGA